MVAPPNPEAARDPADFAACLRALKVWAGSPSFEEMRRRCGVPASTLSDALNPHRARPPALTVVRGFVRACGAPPEALARWESAWRRLRESAPPSPAHLAPHQLPPGVPHFTGRSAELDRLSSDAPVVAVTGPPGAGKTALAMHWAHRSAGAYPDGQLYLDLHGYSHRAPLVAGQAIRFFLGALGVPRAEVPADGRARLALYRSLAYGRRMLVVLDNAWCAEQVRPLIPGGPGCRTLVTSRDRLSGLVAHDGAHRLPVGPLRPDEASELLVALLGTERVRDGTDELARLCGYLPLALRIAAARLTDRPLWTVAGFVARLADGDRFAELSLAGDGAVGEAFALSYARLDERARWLLGQLAALPGGDFSVDDVRAAAPMPAADAHRLLDALAAAHLLEPVPGDRYALDGLLRHHARATLP